MTFAWRPGSQYDVAATRGADSVLASDCRAHFGRPSTRKGCRICVAVRLPVRPRGETMYWQADAKKKARLHELFRKVRANFSLLSCDTSQEPNGNCSDKLVQMNFFILDGFFRVDFPPLLKMLETTARRDNVLASKCEYPPFRYPPFNSGPEKGVIAKGVFSLEESLESLNSLDSLESLENGRILLFFPQSGGSLESLESLNSLKSLENGLFRKDPFSKRPLFPNPINCALFCDNTEVAV